jgi:hypothetical protein
MELKAWVMQLSIIWPHPDYATTFKCYEYLVKTGRGTKIKVRGGPGRGKFFSGRGVKNLPRFGLWYVARSKVVLQKTTIVER